MSDNLQIQLSFCVGKVNPRTDTERKFRQIKIHGLFFNSCLYFFKTKIVWWLSHNATIHDPKVQFFSTSLSPKSQSLFTFLIILFFLSHCHLTNFFFFDSLSFFLLKIKIKCVIKKWLCPIKIVWFKVISTQVFPRLQHFDCTRYRVVQVLLVVIFLITFVKK